MDRDMNILYILGVPLGYVMEWIYNLIPNYGWDIIIFTIVIRLLSIPLQLNQQKSMAKMSAFQPMIADIQKKYKDKPEKQQEELLKLQQEYGYKPTAGCMPMLVNFLVMFGVIEVVYRPLQRIFHIGAEAITAAGVTERSSPLQRSSKEHRRRGFPLIFRVWWKTEPRPRDAGPDFSSGPFPAQGRSPSGPADCTGRCAMPSAAAL